MVIEIWKIFPDDVPEGIEDPLEVVIVELVVGHLSHEVEHLRDKVELYGFGARGLDFFLILPIKSIFDG